MLLLLDHRLSKKGNFTKGRLINDRIIDIIKIDNVDDDGEFINLEKLRNSKTDDFIHIEGLWLLLPGTTMTNVFVHGIGNLIGT